MDFLRSIFRGSHEELNIKKNKHLKSQENLPKSQNNQIVFLFIYYL
jgi:hypothetical protein